MIRFHTLVARDTHTKGQYQLWPNEIWPNPLPTLKVDERHRNSWRLRIRSPRLSRSCWHSLSEQCRPCGEATPWLCRLRAGPFHAVEARQQRLPTASRPTCEVHVAIKHLQTNTCSACAANPCCRRLQRATSSPEHPAVAHTARWWPRASNGRSHRQLRTEKGKG